jgi:amino-acid N-acetyltransferase
MEIRRAKTGDAGRVEGLLVSCGLPFDARLFQGFQPAFVAEEAGRLVGVVALECLGTAGMLRTLAVAAANRKAGVGSGLLRTMEEEAKDLGVKTLYLSTITARPYFEKLGYGVCPLSLAPQTLMRTLEEGDGGEVGGVCMKKALA